MTNFKSLINELVNEIQDEQDMIELLKTIKVFTEKNQSEYLENGIYNKFAGDLIKDLDAAIENATKNQGK
jgi:hypothetical protein